MSGFGDEGGFPEYERVLDEIVKGGYEGTELGDWGFMPTDSQVLRPQLAQRGLELVGALVPWPLADASRHREGVEAALRTARLLAACAGGSASGGGPFGALGFAASVQHYQRLLGYELRHVITSPAPPIMRRRRHLLLAWLPRRQPQTRS